MTRFSDHFRRPEPPNQAPLGRHRELTTKSRSRRAAAGVLAPLVTLGAGLVLVPAADAAVAAGRGIEVFYGRDFVGIDGYPANTNVRVEVHRGSELIGFAEYPTDATGFLEINHTGEGDCWQSPFTPNIEPGDVVSATVAGQTPDSTGTRDVFLDIPATVYDAAAGTITVKGHSRSTAAAPIAAGDVREVRINLNNGVWSTTNRKDLRADVGSVVDPTTGNFTYTFSGLTSADVQNAQAGSAMAIEWSEAGETEPIPEITVFDGFEAPFGSCPPLLPNDRVAPNDASGLVAQTGAGPNGSTAVFLDWAAATDNDGGSGVKSYEIYMDSGTTPVGTVLAPATSFDFRVTSLPRTFTVKTVDAAGNKSAGATVTVGGDPAPDTTPPGAPTGLAAQVTGSSVALSWTAPTGEAAASYQVLRGTTVVSESVTGTTFTDENVAEGTHSYTVKARDAAGNLSTASAAASATVAPPADTTPPGAPTGLAATVTGSSVALSWTAPTGEAAASYQVLRGTTVVADTVTGTTYTNTGVPAGTHNYTVKARDAAGNLSTASNTATVTVAAGDTTAPTVTARTPAVNATGVGVAANVTATFNEAVTGWSPSTVFLRQSGSTTNIAAGVTYNATTRVVTLNPSANLPADRTYTVTLTNGIRDAAGNALTATNWSFTTGPAPTVSARTPASGATAVARAANVTATFSEPVQGVSGTTLYLRRAGTTTNIAAVVSYNATTRVATLNPSTNLLANTRYTVTLNPNSVPVTSRIRDLAGNPVASTNWTFTTGA